MDLLGGLLDGLGGLYIPAVIGICFLLAVLVCLLGCAVKELNRITSIDTGKEE